MGAGELSDREREILAFEREWWQHAGAKEHAVRSQLGMSTADYYRALSAVIDRPAAMAHDPLLVRRLRRMRLTRQRDRSARRGRRRTWPAIARWDGLRIVGIARSGHLWADTPRTLPPGAGGRYCLVR